MLAESLADTDMAAIVSMSGKINSGLTTDRAQLQAAIMKMQPQNLYRMTGSECPNIDYYHADLIENKHNSNALEAAIDEVMSCSPGLDMRDVARRLVEAAAMQSLAIGEQDVRVTFASVREIVRKMAALPGQSCADSGVAGFLLIPETRAEESQIMDLAVQSNVIISALDARGLYTSEIDASEMIKGSAQTSQLKSEYRRNSMSLNENVMAELAYGTGGTYFHNSNDLEGGFKQPDCSAGVSVPVRVFDRRCETEWPLPSPEGEGRSGRFDACNHAAATSPQSLRKRRNIGEKSPLHSQPLEQAALRDVLPGQFLAGLNPAGAVGWRPAGPATSRR